MGLSAYRYLVGPVCTAHTGRYRAARETLIVDYVERISSARKCSFPTAANDIFHAKVSGTFKRFVVQ
ncbi:hypothetical protein BHM03_00015448 [Ensete ventricosum]|uniref:Uncharacterized protein n=1 Tax=Ensete ventricosum TaxID=4639 RepID=A0A427A7S8_ENSVE|nr:hypothetical protein B296_00020276 [Ensete ventricosum]RZR87975.1 hypothetical protein BHM03_00015448 [Ensete ventricosum]